MNDKSGISKEKLEKAKENNLLIKKIDLSKFLFNRYKIETNSRQLIKGLCPFHEDKNPGSFYISRNKKTGLQEFSCKSPNCCAAKGKDIFQYVMQKENVDFSEAKKILMQYTKLAVEPKKIKQVVKEEDFELIHNVYKTIKKALVISKEDLDNLKLTRILEKEELRDIRTWDYRKALDACLKNYSKEQLLKVPGFFLTADKRISIMHANRRIAIFVKNKHNKYISIQLRATQESDKEAKYIMLSGEVKSNMKMGFLKAEEGAELALVEGYFKALELNKKGFAVFYVQGIETLTYQVDELVDAVLNTTRYTKNKLNYFLDTDIVLELKKLELINRFSKAFFRKVIRSNQIEYIDDIKLNTFINAKNLKGVDDYLQHCVRENERPFFYKIDALFLERYIRKDYLDYYKLEEDVLKDIKNSKSEYLGILELPVSFEND